MKFRKGYLVLMYLLCLTVQAESGDRGNGGDVVICGDTIQLLDRQEAMKKKLVLNLPEGTIADKVKAVEDRLRKLDPVRGELFQKYSSELLEDIKKRDEGLDEFKVITFANEVLKDIDDSYDYSIPYGCTKEQLVIRRDKEDIKPYDVYVTEYIIDIRLWDRLDDENKAMTVSHEALYKITTQEMSHTDSRLARHLNGIFSSQTELSFKNYINNVTSKNKNFPFILRGNVTSELKKSTGSSQDGGRIYMFEITDYKLAGPNLNTFLMSLNLTKDVLLFCSDDGFIQHIIIPQWAGLDKYVNINFAFNYPNDYVQRKYNPKGELVELWLPRSWVRKFKLDNKKVKIPEGAEIVKLMVKDKYVEGVIFQ